MKNYPLIIIKYPPILLGLSQGEAMLGVFHYCIMVTFP